MMPILLEIGPVVIYSFGVVVFLGFILASFLCFRRLRDENFEENDIFDGVLFSGFFGLVFSRIFYCALNFKTFGSDLFRILNFGKHVGFSLWGFLFGVFFGIWLFCRKKGWNFFSVMDNFTIPLAVFLIFIQVGCFFNGCNYGAVTTLPWGLELPGTFQKRHPIFLYEAILLVIILVWLMKIEKRWRSFEWYKSNKPGFMFCLFLGIFGLVRVGLDFFSEDKLYWRSLNLKILAPALLGLMFLGILYLRSERSAREDFRSIFFFLKKEDKETKKEEWSLTKKIKFFKDKEQK
jgi:phosphatidylglycerol:prolipoprotein diacylglycerol transferase